MSQDPVDAIARALLYEGYLLYPYRRSAIKNRQRFTFGVLFPAGFCQAGGSDRWQLQAECPVRGGAETTLTISVRFLQLIERPGEPGDAWLEAVEREERLDPATLGELASGRRRAFTCPAVAAAPLAADAAAPASPPDAEATVIDADVRVTAATLGPDVHKLTVQVANRAALPAAAPRDEALRRSTGLGARRDPRRAW